MSTGLAEFAFVCQLARGPSISRTHQFVPFVLMRTILWEFPFSICLSLVAPMLAAAVLATSHQDSAEDAIRKAGIAYSDRKTILAGIVPLMEIPKLTLSWTPNRIKAAKSRDLGYRSRLQDC